MRSFFPYSKLSLSITRKIMILGEGKTECARTKKERERERERERRRKKARLGEHKSVK